MPLIFSIQDEALSWAVDSADNMGLDSMSDPGEVDTMELENEDEPSLKTSFQSQSRSASLSLSSIGHHGSAGVSRSKRSKSEEIDTGEDLVDPITPGPSAYTLRIFRRTCPSTRRRAREGEQLR
ncbi:MAG: hypothetical protein NXY57DRAFT_1116399 [Lentinula lateritia]|nr:MAG: hypothetical protein NXY57DRAFT_1116399 [Lentinula lateritia]